MNLFNRSHSKMDVQRNMLPEKPREIDSEIDWKIIDQLHNAVLNFSRNSMQAKKIMFTLLGIFVTAMLHFQTTFDLGRWLPVVMVIVLLFWAFDAQTYYYQEKLRAAMDKRFESLMRRHLGKEYIYIDEFTLPNKRQKSGRFRKYLRSFTNGSVLFYPVIITILFICYCLIKRGIIS